VFLFIGWFIKKKKVFMGEISIDPVGQAGFVKPITGLIFN
jgi:hypothetical protein